jgi:hypothetical protein
MKGVCVAANLAFVLAVICAAEATEEVVCNGRIVDAKSRPVAEACVRLYELTAGPAGLKAAMVDQATSTADGTFCLKCPRMREPGPSRRVGMILARKEGLAIGWANWNLQGNCFLRIPLIEPVELSGQVVDQAGNCIAGAEVGAFLVAQDPEEPFVVRLTHGLPSVDWIVARTDHQGRFCFRDLPAGCTAELMAWAPGHARVFTLKGGGETPKGQFAPPRRDIKIVLPPESAIEGTALAKESRQPVGGVCLFAHSERDASYAESVPVVTDAEGRFRLSGLRAGHYRVELFPPKAYEGQWIAEPPLLSLREGQTQRGVVFELTRAAMVEVLVTDPLTSEPVADVSVMLLGDASLGVPSFGTTGADGVARIGVTPGRYSGGRVREISGRESQFTHDLQAAPGEVRRITVQLGKTPVQKGVVLDPGGSPVSEAEVELHPGLGRSVRTDPNGMFQLPLRLYAWRTAEGSGAVLLVRHRERGLAGVAELQKGGEDLKVVLGPAVTMSGKVVGGEGKVGTGAKVRAEWAALGRSAVALESVLADKEGHYELPALPADCAYRISACEAPGYGEGQLELKVPKDTYGRLDLRDIVLPLADASLAGQVFDVQGRPIAGARIYADGFGQPSRHATADTEGRFRLEGLCRGRIHLLAESPGPEEACGSGLFDVGAGDARIVLKRSSGQAGTRPSSQSAEPAAPAGK